MKWKDFLYFRKGSKIGVTLLLILILLSLILNVLLSYRATSPIVVRQNDSIVRAFDEYLKGLEKIDPPVSSTEPESRTNRQSYNESRGTKSESRTTLPEHDKKLYDDDRSPNFPRYPRVEKLSVGETISLNSSDTADWKKVPNIGTVYASRIVEYQDRLGGFVRKEQLMEVYGVDNEMYARISPYIDANGSWKKLPVNDLEFKELLRHPYLNYKQVQAIMNLRRRKGDIASIQELAMLDEFTSEDIYRLEPYLAF